jgi:2-methylcitrate dehydratase PrpD
MQTLATSMARFVAGLNATTLPLEVTEKAKVCLLNAYGMGLNGYDTPYAPVARAAAVALDGEVAGGATLLGDGRRTTIGGACLANSALFHGRAQEDTCGAAHFGTVLVPLLTAMIEARHYPLARLLPALVAGYEAGGLLEKVYADRTTPGGFRSSAIYGTIAAAAAAGKLMALEEAQLAAALANAVSFAGGVLQSFSDGTDEWRYQVGVVARNGLLAAELAPCRIHCGAPRVRGQNRIHRQLRPGRPRGGGARRPAWSGVGNTACHLQTLPSMRLQPDACDGGPGAPSGTRPCGHPCRPRPDESF